MSDSSEEKFGSQREVRRHTPSLFGPIVLIAVGVFFLLVNLGVIGGFAWNWITLLQLWPIWLILLGLNIIVRQAPGALGSLFSALVGLLAVAILGYVLLFAEDNVLLGRLRISRNVDVIRESVEFSAEDLNEAVVAIDFSSFGADVFALEDSSSLIAGEVSYTGELLFDATASGGSADVSLDTTSDSSGWMFFANPVNWVSTGDDRWQIGLNPGVPTDLRLDIGSGSVDLELSNLSLSKLELDGGSGSTTLSLPSGNFDMNYDAGSGSSRITLRGDGRQTIDVTGGSGSLTFYLPADLEARVELDGGSGGFNVDEDRFTQTRGDERDEGVWETDDYDDAPSRVDLIIDIGSGSVSIRER